ncbi:hypothetical protein PMAYCL1PPCAC_14751, partial [Pristionchus mayeri]
IHKEYAMQESWRKDEDKLTFIILDKQKYEESEKDEVSSMVGDVNLFIAEGQAEVEIMIADKEQRKRGFGSEAVQMMLGYALEEYDAELEFTAKIGQDNESSIKLFTDNFGFALGSVSEVFREISYKLHLEKHQRFRDFFREKVRKEKIEKRKD